MKLFGKKEAKVPTLLVQEVINKLLELNRPTAPIRSLMVDQKA